ncbi:MAG TPA: hypothetical protein VGA36_03265 [Nitriliruptorales bacterium]
MADKYTSQMALVLDQPADDVAKVVAAAIAAGDIDRAGAVRGAGSEAQEVHWGGRMQRAVVRLVDDEDRPLLRVEAYIGGEGLTTGMSRQAQLLQALARQLRGRVRAVADLETGVDHDEGWLAHVAAGGAEHRDAIVVRSDGPGTFWVHSHGAARFDVPDLELYGLPRSAVDAAAAAIPAVHGQLLAGGLAANLALPSGEAVYLVPVTDAWQQLPLDWPGIGRAGSDRGVGLDGPRATLSLLHRPRFGRYRRDFRGVIQALR